MYTITKDVKSIRGERLLIKIPYLSDHSTSQSVKIIVLQNLLFVVVVFISIVLILVVFASAVAVADVIIIIIINMFIIRQ